MQSCNLRAPMECVWQESDSERDTAFGRFCGCEMTRDSREPCSSFPDKMGCWKSTVIPTDLLRNSPQSEGVVAFAVALLPPHSMGAARERAVQLQTLVLGSTEIRCPLPERGWNPNSLKVERRKLSVERFPFPRVIKSGATTTAAHSAPQAGMPGPALPRS